MRAHYLLGDVPAGYPSSVDIPSFARTMTPLASTSRSGYINDGDYVGGFGASDIDTPDVVRGQYARMVGGNGPGDHGQYGSP